MMITRHESAHDIKSIHDVTAAAFLNAPHTGHTEQFIVRALRDAGVLSISLVAEETDSVDQERVGRGILGHVAVSPVSVSDGTEGWYGLGPISVLPEYQGQGIGRELMLAAIEELRHLQADGCVLLGDPAYYQRFGFEPREGLVLADVPAEYFQALSFGNHYPRGEVSYHQAFGVTE